MARPTPFLRLMMTMLVLIGVGAVNAACTPAVVGVGAASVVAGSTEKGLGTSIADGVIVAKISDAFIQTDVSMFSDISVTVNQGSVLLTGNVELPDQKVQATQIAWQTRGVVEVINEIEVNDKSTLKDLAKDLAAAAQLRAKLITDADISSINFSVEVVNGTVFLAGIASNEEEMQAVVNHARSLRFAQEVVNYITINDDDRQ